VEEYETISERSYGGTKNKATKKQVSIKTTMTSTDPHLKMR
jgi:hypothetical protein